MLFITKKDLGEAFRIFNEGIETDEPDWSIMDHSEMMTWMKRVVMYGLKKFSHGDAVRWIQEGYRNDGLVFWNEKENRFVWPCYKKDDYGSVPPDFRVGNEEDEFSPNHWIDSVDHNTYVFVSDALLEEINRNLEEHVIVHKSNDGSDTLIRESHVSIKGERYKVQVYGDGPAHNIFSHEWEDDDPALYQLS